MAGYNGPDFDFSDLTSGTNEMDAQTDADALNQAVGISIPQAQWSELFDFSSLAPTNTPASMPTFGMPIDITQIAEQEPLGKGWTDITPIGPDIEFNTPTYSERGRAGEFFAGIAPISAPDRSTSQSLALGPEIADVNRDFPGTNMTPQNLAEALNYSGPVSMSHQEAQDFLGKSEQEVDEMDRAYEHDAMAVAAALSAPAPTDYGFSGPDDLDADQDQQSIGYGDDLGSTSTMSQSEQSLTDADDYSAEDIGPGNAVAAAVNAAVGTGPVDADIANNSITGPSSGPGFDFGQARGLGGGPVDADIANHSITGPSIGYGFDFGQGPAAGLSLGADAAAAQNDYGSDLDGANAVSAALGGYSGNYGGGYGDDLGSFSDQGGYSSSAQSSLGSDPSGYDGGFGSGFGQDLGAPTSGVASYGGGTGGGHNDYGDDLSAANVDAGYAAASNSAPATTTGPDMSNPATAAAVAFGGFDFGQTSPAAQAALAAEAEQQSYTQAQMTQAALGGRSARAAMDNQAAQRAAQSRVASYANRAVAPATSVASTSASGGGDAYDAGGGWSSPLDGSPAYGPDGWADQAFGYNETGNSFGDPGDAPGGVGKIVCTSMNERYGFGSFRNKIWLAQSATLDPAYQRGYHAIFKPLLKAAKTRPWLQATLEHIARRRTADIWKQRKGKRDLIGACWRAVLEPLCYVVGKFKS